MLDTGKLAKALKKKRGERTMREAVKASGIPYTSYNRMERAAGTPSAENLMRACDWLGVTLDELRKKNGPDPHPA